MKRYSRRSYNYRKIYEDHYGPIPKDSHGRTYEIHHVDFNSQNNDPTNLIAVSIQEHFEIHYSHEDWGACLAMSKRMALTVEETKQIASKINKGVNNPSYGSKWWNNGVIETRVKDKPIGDDWIPGRLGVAEKINETKNKNETVPSGKKNGRYDHRIHKFVNKITGEVVISTQFDFRITRGLDRRKTNKIVDGSLSQFDGWIVERQ